MVKNSLSMVKQDHRQFGARTDSFPLLDGLTSYPPWSFVVARWRNRESHPSSYTGHVAHTAGAGSVVTPTPLTTPATPL